LLKLLSHRPSSTNQKISIADGRVVDAIGFGTLKISVHVSGHVQRKATLYDVLHVPDLRQNLFLVQSSASKGKIV